MARVGLASALQLSAWGFFPFARRPVGLATIRQRAAGLILALGLAAARTVLLCPSPASAQEQAKTEELSRKVKAKVSPVYPDAARNANIAGTVRLAVVIAPNGSVKSSKPIGGHPLLVNAAMDAMKKWKFEPGPSETSGVVEFKFQPEN
jgi:TonB family protein